MKKRRRKVAKGGATIGRAASSDDAPKPGRGSSGAYRGDEGARDDPPGRMGRSTTTGTAGGPKAPR